MTDELPLFPTTAPDVFADPARSAPLFAAVFARLADVIEATGTDEVQSSPTPCSAFTVSDLRRHVLAWVQFFAAALDDVDPADRPDPETWTVGPETDAVAIVHTAAADIDRAIAAGAAGRVATMSQARMAGDGVLAMALGEYIVHAWDLAVATGHPYEIDPEAAQEALGFLRTMVAPEYRGPDGGFFDAEVPLPEGASPLDQLLCFAGRNPGWTPPGE